MKMRTIMQMVAVSLAFLCTRDAAASTYEDVEYTTSCIVTPGEWNTNFATSLSFAEEYHLPVIMYYGVYGCTYAEKGVKALNQQILKDWFAANKIVMIYKRVSTRLVNKIVAARSAQGSADPDLWLGRAWVKNNSNVANYPIMRIYWNKPDGTVVSKTFSMRYKQMPVTTPAGSDPEDLAGQLLGTLKMYLADYVPGEVTPSVDDGDSDEEEDEQVPEEKTDDDETDDKDDALTAFGTMALSYKGYIVDGDDVAGVISVAAQKAASNGKVKVSGKVTTILGKQYTFSAQTTQAEHSISLNNKNIGQINIKFSDDAMDGTVDGCNIVVGSTIGGFLPEGTGTFIFDDTLPETNGVYTIVHDALPTNETLTVTATRMKAGKSGSVKWNSKTKSIAVSEINPSSLVLTYSSSTGLFKGSFKVYQSKLKKNAYSGTTTGATLSKLSASVSGFVIDGIGIGKATIKGFNEPFDIEIRFGEEYTE